MSADMRGRFVCAHCAEVWPQDDAVVVPLLPAVDGVPDPEPLAELWCPDCAPEECKDV